MSKGFCQTLYGAVLAMLLTACTTAPVLDDVVSADLPVEKASYDPADSARMPTSRPSLEQANRLFQAGHKKQAAEMYYRAAFTYSSPQRERIILQAAEITAALNNTTATQSYLSQIAPNTLEGETRFRYQYVQGFLALQNKQADLALRLLPPEPSLLPPYLRDKVLLVRKRALEMGGKLENGRLPKAGNLLQLPSGNTNPQSPTTAPNSYITDASPILPKSTERLALLLPKSGALGEVGKEIALGVQDAVAPYNGSVRYKQYEVTAANALAEYQKAVSDGADMVIGPLDKEALSLLVANANALSTPILSLNYQESSAVPALLYQFGLSPEDEAQQIADVSAQRGERQAIILVPDSIWGKRLADSFKTAYQARGGAVLVEVTYPNDASSQYLNKVQDAVANGSGAQMLFLGASPTQARLIRPLLKAQAANLPVYATSHIFSGKIQANKDNDLDGIIYTEIPYVLDSIKDGSLAQLSYPRLYALGADSVLIAQNLRALTQQQTLQGKTGAIRLTPQRTIQRRLHLATFVNGKPSALD
ncbi:penicillin-binding protein activator [Thiolinea disciformis]|uniref:penicillin-binding protein activator n=1 Tax=Thiolinea disciformis TaxID=125614 RepID=UPI000367F802|nr:penicillin-binding protein activator [Thiolinea disciformis]